MMTCMLCADKIDPNKDLSELNVDAQKRFGERLSEWKFLSLTVLRNGGAESLKAGHVCPKCETVGLEKIELVMG